MQRIDYLKDILAVVVLYKSEFDGTKTMLSLSKALENVDGRLDTVLYDNSPVANYTESEFRLKNFNITYIHDVSNPGVSRAYNFAAKIAIKRSKKWIMLLDQDTYFDENILCSFSESINQYRDIRLFAPILKLADNKIFSPCRYFFKRGFHIRKIKPGLHRLKNIAPVNSGMLINLEAFMLVNGYNEKVKLDFSDFQFIERFRSKFDHFVVVNSDSTQDFSNLDYNRNENERRFKLYCECASNCEKKSPLEFLMYLTITISRAIKLTSRFRSPHFLIIWFNSFILGKT